jgi:hypothetical protein
MNVEIGTEAAQFPEKEYINVIFLAVQAHLHAFYGLIFQGIVLRQLMLALSVYNQMQRPDRNSMFFNILTED